VTCWWHRVPPTSHGEAVATRAAPELQAGATTRGVAGVVLAGGRSTRLGLLAARPDKITLLVEDQPILIRHCGRWPRHA
jgi:hypothetical protein